MLSAVSHLGLDCLLRSISLNTHAILGNISNSDLINFICILLIVFSTRLLNLHAYFTLSAEKRSTKFFVAYMYFSHC